MAPPSTVVCCPPHQERIFLTEHSAPIGNSRKRLAISPDGQKVVTHELKTYVRYRIASWERQVFDGPQASRDIRFSPAGTLWAVGADSLWIWPEGDEKTARADGVGSLAVGVNGSWVGLNDGALARYSAAGDWLRTERVANMPITGVAQNGNRVIVGTATGDVLIVESDRAPLTLVKAHADAVWAVATGPHGWFATGSGDRTVCLWDAAGQLMFTLPQTRPVRRLFWSDDGRTLSVLAEGERGLRRWRLEALQAELTRMGLGPCLP